MTKPSQPRISPATTPYDDSVTAFFARLRSSWQPPFLYFRVLARDPRLLDCMVKGAPTYLPGSQIDVHTREILLLRVTARARGEYEWGMRVYYFAEEAGLTEAQIVGSVLGSPEDRAWNTKERLVVLLADALHDHADVDDALWAELSNTFSDEAILEMVMLAGFYRTVSCIANTARLPLEEGRCRSFPTPT